MKWSEVKSLSRVQLFATPWTVAYQAPLSVGFSRQEYWSGLPFPSLGDLSDPGIEPGSPTLQADALPSEPLGKSPQVMKVFFYQRAFSGERERAHRWHRFMPTFPSACSHMSEWLLLSSPCDCSGTGGSLGRWSHLIHHSCPERSQYKTHSSTQKFVWWTERIQTDNVRPKHAHIPTIHTDTHRHTHTYIMYICIILYDI